MGFIWRILISLISRLILLVATWNKQQNILCDPYFHIHSLYIGFSHILFFFWCYHFLMLPLCLAGFDYTIHQGPYTKVHTPSYFRGFKCPYTCLFLYRKKLQMSTFLVYLYKKKPLRALKHPYTSIHPYTKFCAQILCSNSVLSFSSSSSLALYFLSIFHWLLLSLVHSALGWIISCAQRTGLYYLLRTAHWAILSLHFSRSGLYYLLFIYYGSKYTSMLRVSWLNESIYSGVACLQPQIGVWVEEWRYDVLPKFRYYFAMMTLSSKSWGSAIVTWLTRNIHAYFTMIAISFLNACRETGAKH